ncbi:MAG: bifunctional serine/threonine-protein kinase/formylglycine-generating enzyme family protein [Pyrinomonadaceae bacterium]
MRECQLCKNCFADKVETCPNDGMPTVHTIPGEPVLEGKYHIECRLGQGGMGVVYKARHAYLKTQLAIKVILPDLVGNDPQLVTRFRQEALAAAAIRHQNVVSVTDYGVIDGTLPFLVMEYVEGEALHDLLAREKALSPERAYELMAAVGAGVSAAHQQGIVHRDLKPLNVMICSDKPTLAQSVKILDFGLAKIKSGELLGSFVQAQTTGLMGSPYYMAPEQWADEEPDSRADVYSLAVMLYQMLTGDVPFKGSSIPAIMKKHISDPAPTLADAGIKVSPELERAISNALQKNAANRTPSVDAFVRELGNAIHPGSASIHGTMSQALPVSSLKVWSKPPKSVVFIDNVSVGQTHDNGALLLEGVQSGNHHLRVSHNGFQDWLGDVVCDGKPQEVVAELVVGDSDSRTAIPRPDVSVSGGQRTIATGPNTVSDMHDDMAKTVQQNWGASNTGISVPTVPPEKKGGKAFLLGIGGLLALLVIVGGGIGVTYMLGVFPFSTGPGTNGATPTPVSSPGATTPAPLTKSEMVDIPGGAFIMGRNEEAYSYGEHTVQVVDFLISKTEITNAEYLDFVKESGHVPPKNWSNGAPVKGTESKPVTFVSQGDAIAYGKWKSQVAGGTYRLPTEQEWEYVARNGNKESLFPWGNDWIDGNAAVGKADSEPFEVGSKPQGANSWGVLDLIGNVFEWTSTEYYRYPGSAEVVLVDKETEKALKGQIAIRGGSVAEDPSKLKVTSTYRAWVPKDTKDKTLGFRLVKEK